MATAAHQSEGAGGARRAARKGLWGIARIVGLIVSAVVGLIVIGVLLVALEANRDNQIVTWVLDAARTLAGPFDEMFTPDGRKLTTAVNWGLAAAIYAIVGGLIVRLLRR